jgi:hypothetical protein
VHPTTDLLSLLCHRLHQVNTNFGSTSHMPHRPCFRLPQNLLVHPTLGYLSSIFATLPQFFLASELCLRLSLLFFFQKLLSFLGCVPLCSYMDSKGHQCESSHPLGVSCPFVNHHTQMNCRAPSWTQCTQTNLCTHQPSCLLDRRTPSLGCVPLALCVSLLPIDETLMGVSMGSSNLSNVPMLPREGGSTPWACAQVTPSFPKHNPSLHQFLRKVRCVPPWCPHVTIVCPRCSCSHPHVFVRPTDHMPLVFSCPTHPQVFPRVCVLGGCHGRPYILPHSKLLSSSTTSIDLHGASAPSLDLVTTQQLLSPQLLLSRKTPLRKLHESMKCRASLTYCCFHTLVIFCSCFCVLDPLVTLD